MTEKETAKKFTVCGIEGTGDGKRYSVQVRVDGNGDILMVRVAEEDDLPGDGVTRSLGLEGRNE